MINFLMFSGIGLLFLGFPISAIVSIVFKIKRKSAKIPVICLIISVVLGLIFIVSGGIMYGETDEYKQSVAEKEQSELINLQESSKEQEKRIKELEQELEKEKNKNEVKEKPSDENQEQEKGTKSQTESKKQTQTKKNEITKENMDSDETKKIESIFYGEIGLNEDFYMGEEVTFSFKVDKSVDEEVEEITTNSNLCYGSIEVQFKEKELLEKGEYITVTGTIGEEHSATVLKDSKILFSGDKAKNQYDSEIENWKNSFYEAELVSYDDLLRYPDTYKEKKIKVTVKVSRVEPDGIIFDGEIEAKLSGESVSLYDCRNTKEPKLREGDTITIYGYGNGVTTVKVKDTSGIIPKTVDKYDIPSINMMYIDFN